MEQDTAPHTSRSESVARDFQFLPPVEPKEHRAQIVLDANGRIQRISKLARQMLGYYSAQRIQPCFFKLIREHQQTHVMWELAEMAGHHRQRAEWVVQLKTGQGAWRWYHVQVRNQLHRAGESGIVLELMPCGTGRRP